MEIQEPIKAFWGKTGAIVDHPQFQARFLSNFNDNLVDLARAVRLRADELRRTISVYPTAATVRHLFLPEFPRAESWLGQAPFMMMPSNASRLGQNWYGQGGKPSGGATGAIDGHGKTVAASKAPRQYREGMQVRRE